MSEQIVKRSKEFVQEMQHTIATRYLPNDRLALKAQMSAVWAIQSPEKAFDFIDEQLRAVHWEKSGVLKTCFGTLCEI